MTVAPHRFEVSGEQEVIATLEKELARTGIINAAVVSVIGAFDRCCISTMRADDPRSGVLTEYKKPAEVTGSGEVRDGKLHLHCVLGLPNDVVKAGHLHWAYAETWFLAITVLPI